MSLKSSFEIMADYNQWINNALYKASSQLDASELSKNRGAFFGSIIGTLNHILVGDIIWLKRFAEHPSKIKALGSIRDTQKPQALDAILYTDFAELQKARTEMDITIREFVSELTDDVISSTLDYKNTKGEPFSKNFGYLILHLFNHQTHHRGQVSTLLSQAGIDLGVTDLLVSIPE